MKNDTRRTMSVPEAGKVLGIGRDAAYSAARRGEIPVIEIGRLLRVPVDQLDALLKGEWQPQPVNAA